MRPAECLENLELKGGWKVLSRITPLESSTGGKFSVGYLVKNIEDESAYLKALDFSKAFESEDPSRELQAMTEAYNFERDLLNKCSGKKRVVTPLAGGTVPVPGNFGALGNVCYLIFELAKGDLRNELSQFAKFDLAWCLRSLHHTAVGIRQLHSDGIAHQDLKPSNILIFSDDGSKVSDLGRASDMNYKSPIDGSCMPGDIGYAPPEQFYRRTGSLDFSERYLADLYLLGSLIFFYFSNCSATQAVQSKLRGFQGINFTETDFQNDLPYLRQAFQEAIIDLKAQIEPFAGNLTSDIVEIVMQLCEPDPARRGDPKSIGTNLPQHYLERYISRLNILATKAEYRMI